MSDVFRYLVLCLCVVSLVGCANMSARQKGFAKGAAVGAVVGGGSGAVIGDGVDDSNRDSGAVIGAVAGALIGGTIGAFMAKEEPAPAPPCPKAEPPAPPAPKPVPPAPVKKEKIVLRGINFDFDKSNIKPEFQPVLDEAAAILAKHANVSVVIEGHTDSIGTEAYNQKLSERRADSVKKYLVGKGIASSRLETVGYGELRPIASNDTAEGRAMNRRVEFKVSE